MKTKFLKQNEIILTDEMQGNDLYNNFTSVVKALLTEGEILVVKKEDNDIIVIEHNHDEFNQDEWGCDIPLWVSEEEYEQIMAARTGESVCETCPKNECDEDCCFREDDKDVIETYEEDTETVNK